MQEGDNAFFYKFFRIAPQLFDKLLSFVAPDLTRIQHIREPLEPGERLAITLSDLASGQEICQVALAYHVIETARQCIHGTCRAIWENLKDHYMQDSFQHTYSIVLMTVVDSSCKYVLVGVGAEGRRSDGDIFKNSKFGKALIKGALDIPSLGMLP
ncbi:hypothetical protein HPB50_013447 [Hyalomma asiaticum]|uniref:Uncharacterized protein n=1 Tax=Hyalomma asiaticum TaxID=266040 RepID=A0ACB7SGK9_HYAAI|nr:hypothetical protein HPB50_013447 [Hyalomma asiaticum]